MTGRTLRITRIVGAMILMIAATGMVTSAAPGPAPGPAPTGLAEARPPVAPVAPVAPATQPSPQELHAEAYALMRADEFDKATPLLVRAFTRTPAAERPRALVLNRALIDLMQKHSVLHGVRELNDHLARNPKHDEAALNIFGSLLDVAADRPKWSKSPIYAGAIREFSRRELAMERLRPGFRRYGARWITEEEWQNIKRRERELIRQMNEVGEKVVRLDNQISSLMKQTATARQNVSQFAYHSHGNDPRQINYVSDCVTCIQHREMREAVNALTQDMHACTLEIQGYHKRLKELKDELEKLKPKWPDRYDPIDPAAPLPPEPANPPLPATTPSNESIEAKQLNP